MHRFSFLLLAVLALLIGCSGGGNSAGGTANNDLFLAIDTSAGTTTELRARVEGVFLEVASGQLTGNLLRGSQVVSLTHPLGEASGLRLAPPPVATYVAVHLLFLPGGLEAIGENGVTERVQGPTQVRVAFDAPVALGPGRGGWLALAHDGAIQLTRRGAVLDWNPRLVAGTDKHFVHMARGQVVKIDRDALAADVMLTSLRDVAVHVRFADATSLGRRSSDENLTPKEFVDGLRIGSKLLISGVLNDDRSINAVAAFDLGHEDDDDDDEHKGPKSEARGAIVELLPADKSFRFRIQEVRKGGTDLPKDRPLTITVRVDDAKIKWVPRHARHKGHLPFDALKVGMCVEVEWFGPAKDGAVKAHKIDIRSEGETPPAHHELKGRITEIVAATRTLLLSPAAKDYFELGDERIVTLPVHVPANATVIDARGSTPRTVGFEAFAAEQNVFVRGTRDGERLIATIALILP
jgi:hypothetical protein